MSRTRRALVTNARYPDRGYETPIPLSSYPRLLTRKPYPPILYLAIERPLGVYMRDRALAEHVGGGYALTLMRANGQRLRMQRYRLGLTQAEVARKISVMPSTISRMERGDSAGSLRTLKKLADLFNVSMDSLILFEVDNQSNVG